MFKLIRSLEPSGKSVVRHQKEGGKLKKKSSVRTFDLKIRNFEHFSKFSFERDNYGEFFCTRNF